LCKTVLKQCNSHETIVKSLISTFRDLHNIRPFSSVHINTRSYNVLLLTHNRISQGCLYSVACSFWLSVVGYQPTGAVGYISYITRALLICLKYTHLHLGAARPRARAYISGKSLVPMLCTVL